MRNYLIDGTVLVCAGSVLLCILFGFLEAMKDDLLKELRNINHSLWDCLEALREIQKKP